jgi:hypothetical protein
MGEIEDCGIRNAGIKKKVFRLPSLLSEFLVSQPAE